jgi:hypothetical protein
MPSTVQVGTILIKEWPGMPQLTGFEAEPGLGEWSRVKVPDAPLSIARSMLPDGISFSWLRKLRRCSSDH